MENKKTGPAFLSVLRQKAEDQLKNKSPKITTQLSEADILKHIHELEVHQIELEIQNEELRLAKSAAQDAVDLYDFAPTGFFSITSEGKIIRLNLQGASMLGRERSRLRNTSLGFFVSGETKPVFNLFLEKIFKSNTKETCELILQNEGNTPMFVQVTGIMAENGENCLITMVNITRRKEIEAEITLQNENLQKLNATKDKFFSIVAFDLRSPFQAILGFSVLLMEHVEEKDYDGIDAYARSILQSSKLAMNILMNLMEWSKSQTGRINFDPGLFDIVEFLHENIPFFEEITNQKSIAVQKDLPQEAIVLADQAMIRTVFRNLVSNAIKFTKPGGKITLSVKKKSGLILVSVKDSGVGIPESRIGNLFRIDQSYSTPDTNNEMGTGLGLILCKEFIEKHGGTIWVESEEGKGSTFSFTLPENNGSKSKLL